MPIDRGQWFFRSLSELDALRTSQRTLGSARAWHQRVAAHRIRIIGSRSRPACALRWNSEGSNCCSAPCCSCAPARLASCWPAIAASEVAQRRDAAVDSDSAVTAAQSARGRRATDKHSRRSATTVGVPRSQESKMSILHGRLRHDRQPKVGFTVATILLDYQAKFGK